MLQSLERLCKEKEGTESVTSVGGVESIVIIDAMVIVQKIAPKPSWVKTAEDISKIFLDQVDFASRKASEIHLVFGTYKDGSLKQNTRTIRKGGQKPINFRIEDKTNIQKISMTKFLSSERTKQSLTEYLTKKAIDHFEKKPSLKFLVSANGEAVGNIDCYRSNNHEEGDTLLVWHAILAVSLHEPDDEMYIHSPDTDVLVILVSFADRLLKKTMLSMSPRKKHLS